MRQVIRFSIDFPFIYPFGLWIGFFVLGRNETTHRRSCALQTTCRMSCSINTVSLGLYSISIYPPNFYFYFFYSLI